MSDRRSERLDGWKAIADYLDKDERTVQRYRRSRGMPVYQVPGGKGGTVFAIPSELDAWLRTVRSTQDQAPQTIDRPGEPAAVRSLDSRVTVGRSVPRIGLQGTFGVFFAGVFAGGLLSGLLAVAGRLISDPDIATVVISGDSVIASDLAGNQVWRTPLEPVVPGYAAPNKDQMPILVGQRFVDLDANGKREIVLLVDYGKGQFAPQSGNRQSFHVVQALTGDGRPLWAFTPSTRVTFGSEDFDGPWNVTDILSVPQADESSQLWLSLVHHTWWPTLVVSLDQHGRETVRFVGPGHVYALALLRTPLGPAVVAAGTSNEHRAGAVALLAAGGRPARAPTEHPGFTCRGCPDGQPLRYFILPPTELGRLLGGAKPLAQRIDVEASGFQVKLLESPMPHIRSLYRFNNDLEPESFAVSDAYEEVHGQQESLGRLTHRFYNCSELTLGKTIRVWDADTGWREIRLPPRRVNRPSLEGEFPGD